MQDVCVFVGVCVGLTSPQVGSYAAIKKEQTTDTQNNLDIS